MRSNKGHIPISSKQDEDRRVANTKFPLSIHVAKTSNLFQRADNAVLYESSRQTRLGLTRHYTYSSRTDFCSPTMVVELLPVDFQGQAVVVRT